MKHINALILLTLVSILSSCGNNILGDSDVSSESILERLRVARTDADFESIRDDSSPICENANNQYSEAVAQEHCLYKAEALAYLADIDTLGIVADINDVVEGESIFSALSRSPEETAAIIQSAQTLNNLPADSLTQSQQLQKAAVNSYSILAILQFRYAINPLTGRFNNLTIPFTIDAEETTYTTGYLASDDPDICGASLCESYENLDFVVNQFETHGYVSNAVDGLTAAQGDDGSSDDILDEDQSAELTDFSDDASSLLQLRNAARDKTSVTLTETGETYNFTGSNLSQSEALIQEALDDLFIFNEGL